MQQRGYLGLLSWRMTEGWAGKSPSRFRGPKSKDKNLKVSAPIPEQTLDRSSQVQNAL